MQFPLQGPNLVNSIHTWTEVPFRNSGDFCCAFQDTNDFFLDLETGVIAVSLPMFVATNVNLTTGVSAHLKSDFFCTFQLPLYRVLQYAFPALQG